MTFEEGANQFPEVEEKLLRDDAASASRAYERLNAIVDRLAREFVAMAERRSVRPYRRDGIFGTPYWLILVRESHQEFNSGSQSEFLSVQLYRDRRWIW